MNDQVADPAEGAEVEPAESTQVEPAPEGDEVGTPLPDTRPPEEREREERERQEREADPDRAPALDDDEHGAGEDDAA